MAVRRRVWVGWGCWGGVVRRKKDLIKTIERSFLFTFPIRFYETKLRNVSIAIRSNVFAFFHLRNNRSKWSLFLSACISIADKDRNSFRSRTNRYIAWRRRTRPFTVRSTDVLVFFFLFHPSIRLDFSKHSLFWFCLFLFLCFFLIQK